jgi:hypothetical protein
MSSTRGALVIIPFGKKKAADKNVIDFDAVYRELLAPAITAAGRYRRGGSTSTCSGISWSPNSLVCRRHDFRQRSNRGIQPPQPPQIDAQGSWVCRTIGSAATTRTGVGRTGSTTGRGTA